MAKGKSASGKNYISQGKHSNVARSTLNAMRRSVSDAQKLINKQEAWLRGSNPWITIPNPNKEETAKRFIRVRMNDIMKGSAKDRQKKMLIMK